MRKSANNSISIYLTHALLTILLLMAFQAPVAFADEPPAPVSGCLKDKKGFADAAKTKKTAIETAETDRKNARESLEEDQDNINNNREAFGKLKAADQEKKNAEETLKKAKEEKNKALIAMGNIPTEDQKKANDDAAERLKTAEKTLESKKSAFEAVEKETPDNVKSLYKSVSEKEKKIDTANKTIKDAQESTEFKRGQILEKYERQIAGNKQKGKELSEQPAAGDDEFTPKLNAGKIKANQGYEKLLEAKCLAELCTADKEAAKKEGACKDEIDAAEAAASELRKQMLELTYLEQQKNAEATFKVTDTISLKRGRTKISDVVNQLADWMITLVGSLAVTTLIIGGGMMIISGGDETRLETGKTIFNYSLIGLVVTLLAYGIVAFLQSLFY